MKNLTDRLETQRERIKIAQDNQTVFYEFLASQRRDRFLSSRQRCYIYVMEAANGLIKIGISNDTRARTGKLKGSSPTNIELAWRLELPNRKLARIVEEATHRILDDEGTWSHGEWFNCTSKKAIEVIEKALYIIGRLTEH